METQTVQYIREHAVEIDGMLASYREWMRDLENMTTKLKAMLSERIAGPGMLIQTYRADGMLFVCAYIEGMSQSKPGPSTLVVEPYIDSSCMWRFSVFERDPNPLTKAFLDYLAGKGLEVTEDRMEGFERALLREEYPLAEIERVCARVVELYEMLF